MCVVCETAIIPEAPHPDSFRKSCNNPTGKRIREVGDFLITSGRRIVHKVTHLHGIKNGLRTEEATNPLTVEQQPSGEISTARIPNGQIL
jgi:hypothetical protein